MADPFYITELRRALIDFPERCNFRFNEEEKKLLREVLFRAISCEGKYLNWFFPRIVEKNSEIPNIVSKILHDDIQWSFSKYDEIVSKDTELKATENHHAYHQNSPCSRIFRRGEPIYRCLTCGFDETCALCSHCYQAEQHKGHTVHVSICQRENGGICDCGDPEAWVGDFTCKFATKGEDYHDYESWVVPPDLGHAHRMTIGTLLDYVIDVISQSDMHLYPPQDLSSDPEKYTNYCTLNPRKYGYDDINFEKHGCPSETYSLIAYNDQIRHYRDAVQRIHLASKKVPEFAIMVTEQIQTHGRATVIRSRDFQLLSERQKILSATGIASCIRNSRDEFRENMCHEIIIWLSSLTERDIFKSNETLKNIFCSCFCCKWQPGLLTLDQSSGNQYIKGKLGPFLQIPHIACVSGGNPSTTHWYFVPSLWDEDAVLCAECDYNQDLDHYSSKSYKGSRFQYLVYFDIRFWKSIRSLLHDFYLTSLITNLKFKKLFACQYVDIYPAVADSFLTVDCEPELNIMSNLSSQLFTCPSNSTSIISHGDVSRIFSTIFNFLRSGQVKADAIDSGNENKLSMTSLKNRRWGQLFFDIGYILSRGKDRELILTNSIIPMACDILSLFQGKPVLKREKEHHVEYENTDYTAFFHAISVVYQFAEYISQSITNLEIGQRQEISSNAIKYVIRYLLSLECCADRATSTENNEVDFGQRSRHDQDEDPDNMKVSFLHPLHSFLSWLIEFSNFDSHHQLKSIFNSTIADFLSSVPEFGDFTTCVNTIFDYPIQTAVLSSQIKSGFWVRNGFSVRSQLQLYKNTSLREQGYLRDLFLVQVFTICADPDTIMSVFLKKWLFYQWTTNPNDSTCPYEPSVLQYIIEECLSFFMHILTEDVFLKGLSTETTTYLQIKSEIIHNLCFGPLSYSRLCSQIPEHIHCEKKFDLVLDELTFFKKSRTSKDMGTYTLKDEYFDDIEPYYFNYTINKKDDAMKLLKERIKKTKNIPLCDIAIYPKQKNVESFGMYKYVANFTTSNLFTIFLIRVIRYIKSEGVSKLDGLLETVLHLIHVCSMEDLIDASQYETFFAKCFSKSPFEVSLASSLYGMLTMDEFAAYHTKIRAIFKTFGTRHENLVEVMKFHVPDFKANQLELVMDSSSNENKDERKKRIAMGRQAKLIAKFKKQQSSFSKINNVADDCSDIDMDDEEEEEGGNFQNHIVPFDDRYWFLKAFSDQTNLNDTKSSNFVPEHYSENWTSYMNGVKKDHVVGPGFPDQKLVHSKLVSSTCGHGMHFHCYMQYSSSNKSRSNQITRNNPDSIEHREFLCPLCKAINNMFIPILWTSNNRSLSDFVSPVPKQRNPFCGLSRQDIHDELWLSRFCESTTEDLRRFSILTSSANEMVGLTGTNMVLDNQQQFRLLLTNMFQILSSLTFPHIFKADCPKTLINSIKSTEISLRGSKPISGLVIYQLSNNNLINLRALNEFRLTSLLMKFSNCVQSQAGQINAHVKYLSNLQTLTPEFFNRAIIYSDFFEVLVTLFPVPTAAFNFNAILHSCFMGTIMQNLNIIITQLLAHDFYSNECYDLSDIPYSELVSEVDAKVAVEAYKSLRSALPANSCDESIVNHAKFGYVLYSMLLKSVTPFLRQSAIYAYVCCANVDASVPNFTEDIELEADLLCSFLKIPKLSEMMKRILRTGEQPTWEQERLLSFKSFLRQPRKVSIAEEFTSPKTMEYPGLIRLVDLPERLDEFFTKYYYSEKYQNPHLKIDNPAICLFCAEIMDVQKRAVGSSYGQCSTHFTRECVSSVGIFLLPKDRCMLLLHKNGGTFHEAPYLDNHGELPAENKKGRTVHLSVSNYDDFIKNSWLQHNVPNIIVRKLDSVIDAGGWDTL
ncbi:hypothetical protein JCM33374_g542 [Metschnikowia sp. JCM 33374]|nr:hypothetical protein JCM33374_g542 [Metschnikowia sp. JCM 33374]